MISPTTPAVLLLWLSVALGLVAAPAKAQFTLENTVLSGIYRSGNSFMVQGVTWDTSKLSDGSTVSLHPWYSGGFLPDLHVTLLTPIDDSFGLLWGFGSGESGAKFRIDPSLTLGFVLKQRVGSSSTVSLRVSTVLGGHLREQPCTADYGLIGGVQQVNCRMADSYLPPAETLKHLFNEAAVEKLKVSLTYTFEF